MSWTQFMDMHSGGGTKEEPYEHIYIEAAEAEARVIFYNRFGHSSSRVSCTCCGNDYSVTETPTLRQATGYERGCKPLETPRGDDGRYAQPDDPWWHEHYYLEPGEEEEAERRGYELGTFYGIHKYLTVEDYCKKSTVLVIRTADIKQAERSGHVPESGYVWTGD